MSESKSIVKTLAVFFAGFIAGRVTNSSNTDKLLIQLLASFDHDLNREEIEFIRNAFSNPQIVQEFYSLHSDDSDSTLANKFAERLTKIHFTSPEAASYLSSTVMNITQKRRCDAFRKFVLDHSDSELIQISDMLRKRQSPHSDEEAETQYDEKMRAFYVPDPTQAEEAAYTIWRMLDRNRVSKAGIMQVIEYLALGSFNDEEWSSFLLYLKDNYPSDWSSFFDKTTKQYSISEDTVIAVIRDGMQLEFNKDRRAFFKQKGLI